MAIVQLSADGVDVTAGTMPAVVEGAAHRRRQQMLSVRLRVPDAARLLARSQQAAFKGEAPDPDQIAGVLAIRDRPDREMLGEQQQRWLEQVLTRSVAAGKPWQLLGNQVVMARVAGPDLPALMGQERYEAALEKMPAGYREQLPAMVAVYRAGVPFSLDSRDGYPAVRERLYAAFARAGSRPVVLSGHSHAAWSNDLYDAGGRLAAVEFGCTAITSPSYGALLPGIGRLVAEANREVLFCDQDDKGYPLLTLTLTLTPDAAVTEHVAVSSVMAKPFTRSVVARHRVTTDRAGDCSRTVGTTQAYRSGGCHRPVIDPSHRINHHIAGRPERTAFQHVQRGPYHDCTPVAARRGADRAHRLFRLCAAARRGCGRRGARGRYRGAGRKR